MLYKTKPRVVKSSELTMMTSRGALQVIGSPAPSTISKVVAGKDNNESILQYSIMKQHSSRSQGRRDDYWTGVLFPFCSAWRDVQGLVASPSRVEPPMAL